jgi:hypothetical protein
MRLADANPIFATQPRWETDTSQPGASMMRLLDMSRASALTIGMFMLLFVQHTASYRIRTKYLARRAARLSMLFGTAVPISLCQSW